jgi:hypothetical protein
MVTDFNVHWRNPGHWDVYDSRGRVFCIRGRPGDFCIRDERKRGEPQREGFATVDAAMAWICSTLMYEPQAPSLSNPTSERT